MGLGGYFFIQKGIWDGTYTRLLLIFWEEGMAFEVMEEYQRVRSSTLSFRDADFASRRYAVRYTNGWMSEFESANK